jgi:predicted ATP-grasp superfamily ATP-dependent carboligase
MWSLPLVVKEATLSCPEIDASAKAEANRTTAAPKPDTVNAEGKPYVSVDAIRKKTDELRSAEERKNRAIKRVLKEHDRCRSGAAAATS